MKIISNLNELMTNIQTLDRYLYSQVDSEYDFALNLIKRGNCFVAAKDSNTYRFYPSRFIGYTDNSMDVHLNNATKDVKETNPAISKVLSEKPLIDLALNQEYAKYCEALGFVPRDKGHLGLKGSFGL